MSLERAVRAKVRMNRDEQEEEISELRKNQLVCRCV